MRNLRIAHFITDEKFPDSAYKQFEAVHPGASTFYIASKNKELKYIKEIEPIFIARFSYLSNSFIKKLLKKDLVLLHSLTPFNIEVALRLAKYKDRPTIVWIGMGYDYYDLIYRDKNDLFLDKTKKIVSQISLEEKKIKNNILGLVKKIAKQVIYTNLPKKEVLRSIDYFAPVLPKEFEMTKKTCFSDAFPEYIRWNYSVNANLIDREDGLMVDRSSKDILLGNSATYANNHIEIMGFLNNHQQIFDNIVCPLSYGGDEGYGAYIKNYGKNLFGKKFKAMTGFVSYDEYMEKIRGCSVVIMNHIRQQAGGNIAVMLKMGATVFLRKENPIYEFYKSQGVTIFSIQDLENNPELIAYQLSDEEINNNKQVLRINFGWLASLEKTQNLINLAKG